CEALQCLRAQSCPDRLVECMQQRHRSRVQLAHPEVLRYLLHEQALIGDQVCIEGDAALEGMLLQHALTESVDGENRRLIESVNGGQQASIVIRRYGLPAVQYCTQGRIVGWAPAQQLESFEP